MEEKHQQKILYKEIKDRTPKMISRSFYAHSFLWSSWLSTGAILAMGRGGRKTTLWPVQKEFFDKKLVILCLQTNITR